MSSFLSSESTFRLDDKFIKQYIGKQPEFGPLGLITYKRTYSRSLDSISERHRKLGEENGLQTSEEFWLTLVRVIEGVYRIQEAHCKYLHLPWSPKKAQHSAQEMFKLMWEFKFLPPGRGLWMMGTPAIDLKLGAALNNCSFVSTDNLKTSFSDPFCFLMDMSMLGVGVGGDTRGAGTITIKKPRQSNDTHMVEDTREGWINIVRRYLDAYVGSDTLPKEVDFSLVRKEGAPIKGFGGIASGPAPLAELLLSIQEVLNPLIGETITSTAIVDLFNLIGRCVVSGNVRRSAEIMFGDPQDDEFIYLKDKNKWPKECDHHRWASNNSIFATTGMDYKEAGQRTALFGEPGYEWLSNAQAYSRMKDPKDFRDANAAGGNPCQPAWATILTPSGISTIGNLEAGDIIWTGSQWTKVLKKWSTGIKPVYAYHTRAGIFNGTENHRVLSCGDKIEVSEAETIDSVTGPKKGLPLNIKNPYPEDHLINIMDGLVLGDGTVHKASNNLVGLLIGKDDQDYFKSEISKLIGLKRPGIGDYFYEIYTSLKSEDLPLTFNRKIPKKYFFASPREQALFLRGLYSANGSLAGNRITLKSSSKKLIQDVQQMLSALGIRSYYTVNKPQVVQFSNGTYECKESYDLNITSDRKHFRDAIGFIQEYKQNKLEEICLRIGDSKYSHGKIKQTYEIVEREYIGEEEVFDLTVEAPEHTYWTGGLLVSNCLEQTLETFELCTLVETFPSRHSTYEEFERTLKFAYLYAKTVTLVPTHDPRTNAVLLRNRRIGTSMSGIVQAFQKFGRRNFLNWCDEGYLYLKKLDKVYSKWLCIPESIKISSVKPSGTISLLPGVTPGIHYPHSEYYWRVIRFASNSILIPKLKEAGYKIVQLDEAKEPNTTAVYFPIKENYFDRGKKEVSMWEQLENTAQVQAYWADNQVSATITFTKKEGKDIPRALELYETRLKGISFLPLEDHKYEHAPYQTITKEEYEEAIKDIKSLDLSESVNEVTEKYCDSDKCLI